MSNGTRKPNLRSSIYYSETDGYWHGWVTMGTKDDGSLDRRHRKSRTETEVTAKVRELEKQRDAGKTNKPGRAPTVEQWFTTYLDTIAVRKLAPRTYDDYWSKARNWIIPGIGQHRLDRLQPEHLDTLYAKMHAAGKAETHVLKVHRIISRALSVAVRRGHVARNVATLVDAPSASEAEIVPLTQDETRAILAAALKRPNAARWSVGLALGLRQGEALGLRWQYVDLDNGLARVWWQLQRTTWRHGCDNPHACGARLHRAPCPKTCTRHRHREGCAADCRNPRHLRCPKPCPENCARHRHRPDCASDCAAPSHQGCPKPCLPNCQRHRHRQPCPPDCAKPEHRGCPQPCPKDCADHARTCPKRRDGGLVFREPKGKSKRVVPLPPELVEILREHRQAQLRTRMAAGTAWTDHDLVFSRTDGEPIDPRDDFDEWKALLVAAGVHDARLHDGRHTSATLLLEQGVDVRIVMALLGHSDLRVTTRYTHVTSPLAQEAARRMGRALWGGTATRTATETTPGHPDDQGMPWSGGSRLRESNP